MERAKEQNSVTKWRPTWKARIWGFLPRSAAQLRRLDCGYIREHAGEILISSRCISDSIYSPKLRLTASRRQDGDKPETALPRGPKAEHEYFCNCPMDGSPEHLKWLPPCMPRARLQKRGKIIIFDGFRAKQANRRIGSRCQAGASRSQDGDTYCLDYRVFVEVCSDRDRVYR